jgi:hypothetical protein
VVDEELIAIGIICMSVINTLDSTHMCYTTKIRRLFGGNNHRVVDIIMQLLVKAR